MSRRIFRSTMFVALIVLICSVVFILGSLYTHYDSIQSAQLRDELALAAAATEQSGLQFLRESGSSRYRLTWINTDGTVLHDTRAVSSEMENHADREEFTEALAQGRGSSIRYSATQTERTIYEAVRLADGTVLRISVNRDSALGILLELLPPTFVVIALTVLLSLWLSKYMAKRIVEPINRIDPDSPLESESYPEIAPLLHRLQKQKLQIEVQLRTLRERAEEFLKISNAMQEGLVVFDAETRIRSINPAAAALFGAKTDCVGRSLLLLDTSADMRAAVNEVLDKGHCTVRLQRSGRHYRFDLSRIDSEQAVLGAVLLAIDITETVNAQKNRQEFSANVSHELKTPLQTILGSAELLENGIVQLEDQPRFYGHIRKEAARLLDLVQDILHLSQLDEGAAQPMESVELFCVCQEVLRELDPLAQEKNVRLSLEAEPCTVQGIRRLLHELIGNLCDNAIKYNVAGGSVQVRLKREKDHILFQVQDTGIGIPPEHQSRVFERFYRVDKSHSKASGGTGLGLSIVKHAAEYHGATLELQSQADKGTCITLRFPNRNLQN